MCQPTKHDDPLQGAIQEALSASSALNMPAEEIQGSNAQQYMTERFVMAKHAHEHIHAAVMLLNDVHKEREAYRRMTMEERIKKEEERQRTEMKAGVKSSVIWRNRVRIFTIKWCKLMLLNLVELADVLARIVSFNKYFPHWHTNLLFSKFMDSVD